MRRRSSLINLSQISDINMTPLMDLTFILLITFIITFPLIEQGIAINLPKGKTTDLSEKISRSISINANNNIYIDDRPITQNELENILNNIGSTQPETTIFIRADQKLAYGKVMEIMRILHSANITSMALVTEAEN